MACNSHTVYQLCIYPLCPSVCFQVTVHHILQFTTFHTEISNLVAVTLKPEPGDSKRVKLQGRWSVILLHSPTLFQQSAATTQLFIVPVNTYTGSFAYNPSLNTALRGKMWEEREPMKCGSIWQQWDIYCMLAEANVSDWEIFVIRNQKMALFSIQRLFFTCTNWLAVYFKEKGKRLPHTLKKEYRHNFLTSSRPWHALCCLLCICNYSPQDSVQNVFFFFFAFCPLYQIQTRALFTPLLLSCVYT